MRRPSDLVHRTPQQLLRWRWVIVAFIGAFNIAVEILEDGASSGGTAAAFHIVEILLFGVLGPLLGGIALTLVAKSREKQERADRYLSQHRELVGLLGAAGDWDELTSLVVRFPRRVADVRGACLLIHDGGRDRFQLDAEWWDFGEALPTSRAWRGRLEPGSAYTHRGAALCAEACDECCAGGAENMPSHDHACLSLTHGAKHVGRLVLFLSPGTRLAEHQMEALQAMAASMAIALYEAQPQRAAMIQAMASDVERQRIARDLHDTLGQSLGYLRLKLDQLTGEDPVREIRVISQELEQMRAVAADAYLQVRRTISELKPLAPDDLVVALQQQAHAAADRAGFAFELAFEGVPGPLSSQARHQLLYLLGEALHNVEKHAAASRVEMHLTWKGDRLEIRLADNGKGFDPAALNGVGHYGLGIMQQRALAIDAQLTIASAPGQGTEVLVTVPTAGQPERMEVGSHEDLARR